MLAEDAPWTVLDQPFENDGAAPLGGRVLAPV